MIPSIHPFSHPVQSGGQSGGPGSPGSGDWEGTARENRNLTGKEQESFQGKAKGKKRKNRQPKVKKGKLNSASEPKEATDQIDEAIDKGLDSELEWSPAVHLLVPLGPLRGIRLVDQVAHPIFGLRCHPWKGPISHMERTDGDRSKYNMAKRRKRRDPNQFRLEQV